MGVTLEMANPGLIGSLRVLGVYTSGIVAGSLASSVFDPHAFLAGASGGVYALISGWCSNIIRISVMK